MLIPSTPPNSPVKFLTLSGVYFFVGGVPLVLCYLFIVIVEAIRSRCTATIGLNKHSGTSHQREGCLEKEGALAPS